MANGRKSEMTTGEFSFSRNGETFLVGDRVLIEGPCFNEGGVSGRVKENGKVLPDSWLDSGEGMGVEHYVNTTYRLLYRPVPPEPAMPTPFKRSDSSLVRPITYRTRSGQQVWAINFVAAYTAKDCLEYANIFHQLAKVLEWKEKYGTDETISK
jgi:hypothetical protein